MNDQRWFAILVGMFGIFFLAHAGIIAQALAPIPPGQWPPPEEVAKAEEAQRMLAILASAYVAFGIVAIVSSIGLFLGRAWSYWLWGAASVALITAIAIAHASFNLPWHEHGPDILLALWSFHVFRKWFRGRYRAL